MMQRKDWIMVITCLGAMALGLLFPDQTSFFAPLAKGCMMVILYLNFLDILPYEVVGAVGRRKGEVLCFLGVKMLLLPALAYGLFSFFWPKYALSALLLGGISCGVAGPVFAGMFSANAAYATALIFLTSMIVPLTLPLLVQFFSGLSLDLSLWQMMGILAEVVLAPFFLAALSRRFFPRVVAPCRKVRYSAIIVLFSILNMGIFSAYGHEVAEHPGTLLTTVGVDTILALLFFFLPLFLFRKSYDGAINASIGCGIINNAIAVVFAASQFGATEAITAALYSIPYFICLIPLGMVTRRIYGATP
ncbi:MAG: hypothetical protein MI742_13860 [Desulfobacterales bacterium]|nr:hypothetical protein [Desulfobacterales bacterium]